MLHRVAEPGTMRCAVVSELPMGYMVLLQVRHIQAKEDRFVTLELPRTDVLFKPGTEVWVVLDPMRAHVFDSATQERVVLGANA